MYLYKIDTNQQLFLYGCIKKTHTRCFLHLAWVLLKLCAVDIVGVLAEVLAAAVPHRVGSQVVRPGLVACGVEVYAVLGGVVIVLAAVGGIGQHLAHIDEVAALAQRHIGQQVVGGGNRRQRRG